MEMLVIFVYLDASVKLVNHKHPHAYIGNDGWRRFKFYIVITMSTFVQLLPDSWNMTTPEVGRMNDTKGSSCMLRQALARV